MKKYWVMGRTYPIRDELKRVGCTYDPDLKVWEIETDDKSIIDSLRKEYRLRVTEQREQLPQTYSPSEMHCRHGFASNYSGFPGMWTGD